MTRIESISMVSAVLLGALCFSPTRCIACDPPAQPAGEGAGLAVELVDEDILLTTDGKHLLLADGAWIGAGGLEVPHGAWLNWAQQGPGVHSLSVLRDGEGNVRVLVDGQPVPEGRIIREGDRIKVLSEKGEKLLELPYGILAVGGGDLLPQPINEFIPMNFDAFARSQQSPRRIGITMVPVDPALCAHLGLEADEVVMVGAVQEELPAARAGLTEHDIITHVNGEPGVTGESLRQAVQATAPGKTLRLRVLRRGIPHEVEVTVEEVKSEDGPPHAGQPRTPEELHRLFPALPRLVRERLARGQGLDSPIFRHGWRELQRPGGAGSSDQAEAIERLEKRLERLETMLEELLEKSQQPRTR